MVPMGERFEMRVDENTLRQIDEWRSAQEDVPSRSEAARRLIELGLSNTKRERVSFTDGEKVLIVMMRDLFKHLKVKEGEIDADFMASMIFEGQMWAATWQMPGLFQDDEAKSHQVRIVADIMTMWDFIERGYERLAKADKAKLKESQVFHGAAPHFEGFDGNNETAYVGIARFLVEKLGRFSRFKGRDFNSHMPSLGDYQRMLRVFQPMLKNLGRDDLTADQLIAVLKAH